jgi:hypothetical protein
MIPDISRPQQMPTRCSLEAAGSCAPTGWRRGRDSVPGKNEPIKAITQRLRHGSPDRAFPLTRPGLDLSQRPGASQGHSREMNRTEERRPAPGTESPEAARIEEMRRLIDEYANDLREIVRQLRRRLLN